MSPAKHKTRRTPEEHGRLVAQLVEDGWTPERAEIEAGASAGDGEGGVVVSRETYLAELLEDDFTPEQARQMTERLFGEADQVRLLITI